jgi:hypothetical protein
MHDLAVAALARRADAARIKREALTAAARAPIAARPVCQRPLPDALFAPATTDRSRARSSRRRWAAPSKDLT